jgi:eukaryotic-like serine/threonine-protein kinase
MMQPFAASPYPGPGDVVGESWRVEKILGEGGMGCVARAYHTVLHTPVALKFMNPQFMIFPGAVERFINEGKASGRIKNDHVVPVLDARKLPNGTPYLVMECLDGLDLADLLARDGAPGLPVERAVHFVAQILRGLQAAHALGIVHRDMKPSNCFVVEKDGEPDFVKILDFGISKVDQGGNAPALTRTNSTLGTPLYMSPEQAQRPRDVDARTDLYSTGAIFYELLVGRAPFFSEGIELLEVLIKLVTTEPPPVRSLRPDLSEELAAVIHKALARDPADRYQSALAMAEALAPFASAGTVHVIDRVRGYKAPARVSLLPPEGLPSSMQAFSQLDRPAGSASRLPAAEPSPLSDTQLPGLPLPATPLGARGAARSPATPGAAAASDTIVLDDVSGTELMPPEPPQIAPTGTLFLSNSRATIPAPAPVAEAFPPSQRRPAAKSSRLPVVLALSAVVAFGALGGALGVMRGDGGKGAPAASPAPPPPPRDFEAKADPAAPAPSAPPGASALALPPPTNLTELAQPSNLPGVPSGAAKPPPRPAVRPTAPRDPGFDPGIKN